MTNSESHTISKRLRIGQVEKTNIEAHLVYYLLINQKIPTHYKNMINQETLSKILEKGLSRSADFVEIFVEDSNVSSINLLDRKIDQIKSSNTFGIGIRLLFGDEVFYGYSSDPDEECLLKLTGNLAESGRSGQMGKMNLPITSKGTYTGRRSYFIQRNRSLCIALRTLDEQV